MSRPNPARARVRAALAVVGAAALLVGGVNLVAVAATGKPILAGKTNKATKTTTIKVTGNKPALKLKTKKTKPPLAVNSKQLVKKLNAEYVGGKTAAELAPGVTLLTTGLGDTPMPPQNRFQVPLAPGTYRINMTGLFRYGGTDPDELLICSVVDERVFSTPLTPAAAYAKIFTYGTAQGSNGVSVPVNDINATNVVTFDEPTTLVYGCSGSEWTQLRPLTVTIQTEPSLTSKQGTFYSPPVSSRQAGGGAPAL